MGATRITDIEKQLVKDLVERCSDKHMPQDFQATTGKQKICLLQPELTDYIPCKHLNTKKTFQIPQVGYYYFECYRGKIE